MTALVVHDLLKGKILKTPTHQGWHYYNYINGERYDFTASQFPQEMDYQDIVSNREEAFSDTNQQQYAYLKNSVEQLLREG